MRRRLWQRSAAPDGPKKKSNTSSNNSKMQASYPSAALLSPEAVASLPPPGMGGPTQLVFSPGSRYLAYVSVQPSSSSKARPPPAALYKPLTSGNAASAAAGMSASDTLQALAGSGHTPSTSGGGSSSSDRLLLCLDLSQANPSATSSHLPHQPYNQHQPLIQPQPLLQWNVNRQPSSKRRLPEDSLEERLRRERQRFSSSLLSAQMSLTHFSWTWHKSVLRILVPARGSLYLQDGLDSNSTTAVCIHDRASTGQAALDAQLSPDGALVAWTCEGDLYVQAASPHVMRSAIRLSTNSAATQANVGDFSQQATLSTAAASSSCLSHGVADFVAQEEMDRYQGFWWHPDSTGLLFTRTDESKVPLVRIPHANADHDKTSSGGSSGTAASSSPASYYEDHRYPFAGKDNPSITLGYLRIDVESVLNQDRSVAQQVANRNWHDVTWFDPPREASEYLARVHWFKDGSAVTQWQNRKQDVAVLYRLDLRNGMGQGKTLLVERSQTWINLHHMFQVLEKAVHPADCVGALTPTVPLPYPLREGSYSFIFASERTQYCHLYLYTYCPGLNGDQAVLVKPLTAGDWVVESIVGVDEGADVVYVTGTFDSPLERHLYAVPLTGRQWEEASSEMSTAATSTATPTMAAPSNGVRRGLSKVMNALKTRGGGRASDGAVVRPIRLTAEPGMHSIVMDDACRYFCDTSSDLDRPTVVRIYAVPEPHRWTDPIQPLMTLYDAAQDESSMSVLRNGGTHSIPTVDPLIRCLPPPELVSFPTSDGTETLHAALYKPDARVHGPGPWPLVCAVYGGPHVQRVNRSWAQCVDMRAQRLRSLGFCVVKCDNRGSSRRGLAFESAIARRLGRLEVLDQVQTVRQLVMRGVADPARVGIYGWSYGGYLAAMCLCRAPDVFHVAVAGAPVTSWDGYDTHYTERYMGLPADNPTGYRESAVLDHVPNMRGKLMLVHGLIDENVHFRHTTRLINKLMASNKEYDLLLFPEERHSPRRLRDRIYMEQRISDYFVRHFMAGHL